MFLALFAQGLASCGDDGGDQACTPGDLKACAIAGEACEAVQTCNSDGSGFSDCACPDEAGGGGGSAGAGGSGGAAGAAGAGGTPGAPLFDPVDRAVGAPCNTDADCPTGPNGEAPLTCITPTSSAEFGTGSPQGGYCTIACRDTDECQALDGLAACGLLDAGGDGYCIGLCQPGAEQNLVKCNADRAQACIELDEGAAVGGCFPVCQSDAACGAGQFCDFGATGLGLCVSEQPPGGDVGAPCTRETAGTDCRSGTCLVLLDPETGEEAGSFCSANCTFGLLAGCGSGDTAEPGARGAVCLQPQLENGGPGDIGFCFELCDEDADCAQAAAGWTCAQTFDPDVQDLIGRLGECVPPGLGEADGGVVVDAGN